ncbi:MAG: protein kinase [Deltaproteobacteria bacterium]|nr:protein kinase [Deltaproteobacteria bacterium]
MHDDSRTQFADFPATARFRPIACLGSGSIGVVYRVHDLESETDVALKTVRVPAPDRLYSLKQEFRALAGIVHPNLIELYELFVAGESCFFTMELVDGIGFAEAVAAGLRDGGKGLEVAALSVLCQHVRQVVAGLSAVHEAGKLHRDVKPSNIMVTTGGRIVVLDFGLATALHLTGELDGFGGSPAYMAPEQAWGRPLTPAADWYALGVVLYEALTGELPFTGSPARIIRDKARPPLRSARALRPDIPAALDELITALLHSDPMQRPGAAQILECLAECDGGRAPSPPPAQSPESSPFVGRENEMACLAELFAAVRAGAAPVVAHVVGPSGIGKTALAQRFIDGVGGEALVLRGRCRPQESVPYNALDAVVDALSRHLLSLSDDEVARLGRLHPAELAQLFPVLRRVALFSAQPPPEAEPHEIRRRGVAALRELLRGLGKTRPVIVWVDDVQWSDIDSALLLLDLLRGAEAPRMLLLLSYRSEAEVPFLRAWEEHSEDLRQLRSEVVQLAALSPAESLMLAGRLRGDAQGAQRIAAEAAGSPFLLCELARLSAAPSAPRADEHAPASALADVVSRRLQPLAPAARRLLEVVAVAARPIERELALRVAHLGAPGRPVVARLADSCLLRSAVINESVQIEPYHDRIGEALLASLPADQLRRCHGELADEFERLSSPEPEALLRHCLGAGRPERAALWGERAADRAAEALAFRRAAELYGQVLELQPEHRGRPALLAKHAEALANAGHTAGAAAQFEAAAQAFEACGAEKPRVLDLRRRAGEHYLRSGHVPAGTAAMRAVLDAVGVSYPRSPGKALLWALALRARLAWRGLKFHPRTPDEIPPELRLRLDTCWGTCSSFAMIDQVAAEVVAMRHLLDALNAGDALHIARGLAIEIPKTQQIGGRFLRQRAERLVRLLERLTTENGGPYEHAMFHASLAGSAFEDGKWSAAWAHADQSTVILRQHCRGVAWETVTFEGFALSALAQMGELREVGRRLPLLVSDAEERGDLYAQLCFKASFPNLVYLAEDRPDYARRVADEAIGRWPSSGAFDIEHYFHLIAGMHLDLYAGGWGAWRRINEVWPKLQRALLLAMESPRVELRNMRARAALAAASTGAGATAGGMDRRWTVPRLLRLAARDAARIARDTGIASASPFSKLLLAGVAHAEGRPTQAADAYAEAACACASADMNLYAAAARYREGELRGGDTGQRLRSESEDWMRAQGIQNPAAMARVWCPVDSLELDPKRRRA